jgi:hypothetical protein
MRDFGYMLAAWWRRQSADWKKRVLLPRLSAVSLVIVIAFIAIAKFAWGNDGPGIITPFAFAGLFAAAVILFAVAIASCEDLVADLEASRPLRVRKRGVVPRALRTWIAAFGRAVLVWLVWLGAAIRREVVRRSAAQWRRAIADSLAGIAPAGASPEHAGALGRPHPARVAPRPRRIDDHHWAVRRSRPREQARATLELLRGHSRGRPVRASRGVSGRRSSDSRS